MRILAIETSCDETALALVECSGGLSAPRVRVVKNLVASQVAVHAPWGGVVPMLAKREHLKNLPLVFSKLSAKGGKTRKLVTKKLKTNMLAVTVGPGLEPALWAGIEFAKELQKTRFPKTPLIGVNHLEGHLYSFLLTQKTANIKSEILNLKRLFPAVALIVSGGHTILLRVDSLTKWKKLGETRDDAVGEAFDKVARILGLPYPGGPEIEKLAAKGNPDAIPFPRPMLHSKDYDFSFSGLKTAVLYYVHDQQLIHPEQERGTTNNRQQKADIAASFQKAAVDVLATKTARAAREVGARSILLSGGVAANSALRRRLSVVSRQLSVTFVVPPVHFNTDNATMIAVAAYVAHLRKRRYPLRANGTLGI
ncbi:MAG: tRNA (adenosine(37)-N6)-threonylcarbamoyltransferase complex transferase subunit TsaD [bacterium]|nr:tRNA (adenosine(37)-N6)-threonylcarbamoyltransferase complex transferase subunit TsaD [bacterium]